MSLESNHPAVAPTAPNQKEEMSNQEASWHSHVAGQRATAEATDEGANPSAIQALINASDGGLRVGGLVLRPATKGTVFTLQEIAKAFASYADVQRIPSIDRTILEDNIAIVVFVDALRAHQRFVAQGITALIKDADALQWKVNMRDAVRIQKYVMEQMQVMQSITGPSADEDSPGKHMPETPAGASLEINAQPQVMTSPSSNGSWPTTGSASLPPSGNSPLPQQLPSSPPTMNDAAETPAQTTPPAPASEPGTAPAHG